MFLQSHERETGKEEAMFGWVGDQCLHVGHVGPGRRFQVQHIIQAAPEQPPLLWYSPKKMLCSFILTQIPKQSRVGGTESFKSFFGHYSSKLESFLPACLSEMLWPVTSASPPGLCWVTTRGGCLRSCLSTVTDTQSSSLCPSFWVRWDLPVQQHQKLS